jgi:hypothetical protein
VFLSKKFKEKKSYFPELFLNEMIMNIKIQNILDIIEISKSMEPNKCIQNLFLWKCLFKFILSFFKVWWVQENQGVMFLVVLPKDGLAHNDLNTFEIECVFNYFHF